MTELSHIEYGDAGRALIVMHGLFGSARNWGGIARKLAEKHKVFALDLRNHGASSWTGSMTYEEMADDVSGFIEAHGIEEPVVIGHSMGGKVAMQLALREPDLAKALVVVDIAPVSYGHDMLDYVAAMQMLDLASKERRAEIEEELAGKVADPGITAFLMTNLERANGGFQWRINLTAISAGMSGILSFNAPEGSTYRGPTLFIAGGNSAYIRDSHKPRIMELFPKARTVTIKDAAHWVHADRPDAFVKTVDAFLDAVG